MAKSVTRVAVIGIALIVTVVAAFGGASYALGSDASPRVDSDLAVGDRPVTPLSGAEALAINNLIGVDAAERYGITAESFTRARHVIQTSARTFNLIPGTRGACLATAGAVACGNPGSSSEPFLALLVKAPGSGNLVGGGVASKTTRNVVLSRGSRVVASLPVRDGVFVLPASADVKAAAGHLEFGSR